jgi:UDP-N-acetyl-2-amino-2-deoxyglucuronate dehydrogenase
MLNKKVNFAVIGCGHIGKRHTEKIFENKESNLVAVCDISESRAIELGKKYNVPYFLDYKDLLKLENIDVVNICTPNGLHAEMSIEIAKHGKNILCEKPMALNTKDAQNMILAAEKNNVKLLLVKQNRFNPPVIAAKEALFENKLGKITMVIVNCLWNRGNNYYAQADWRGTKELDGGILFTQFSHFVDLMLYLVGDVKSVFGSSFNLNHKSIEIDDVGSASIKFVNDAVGSFNYTTNIYESNYEGSLTIIGTKGTIKIGGQYLNELEFWNVEGEKVKEIEKSELPNNYGFYKGSMSNHAQVIENTVKVLKNNGLISTTAMEGYKTIELIQAMYKSAKESKEIYL